MWLKPGTNFLAFIAGVRLENGATWRELTGLTSVCDTLTTSN